MFEKTRTLNLKKEIISELQLILKSDLDKELQSFKNKCEKLVSKSYANSINQIEILQKEIICKDHIINDLLTTIKNLKRENRNNISTSPTDTQNSNEIIEEIESDGIIQTNSKQNPTYGDETNKFETSNNKLIEQLTVVRQEKHKKYEEFLETKKLKSLEDKDDVSSSDSSGDSSRDNHHWPTSTCAIIGDSILTGMEDNRFQNIGRKVKIFDHSNATIDDLHHHIIPILKRKPDQNTNVFETGLSDFHKLTTTVLKMHFQKKKPNVVVHRDFKKFRNDLFRLELDNELIKHDINNIEYDHFINIFTETLSKHAPLKKWLYDQRLKQSYHKKE